MERHLTTSTASIDKQNEMASTGINRLRTVFDRGPSERPERDERLRAPSAEQRWAHTLILTGELTHRSAHTLEVERLRAEGVTSITLDLRKLGRIDPTGVAVIAFRCGLCQRHGCGFTLIPGSRSIQRAFERAGVHDLLPFHVDEVAARRLRVVKPRAAFARRS
jgi:anti-anti-sigma factor